jgi:hypothetical protein
MLVASEVVARAGVETVPTVEFDMSRIRMRLVRPRGAGAIYGTTVATDP